MVRTAMVLAALATVQSYRKTRLGSPDGDGYTRLEDPPEPQEVLPKIKVRAYWVRHGTSCANVLQMQAKAYKFGPAKLHGYKFTFYQDPALTDCAILRAKQLGPKIWKKIVEDNPDSPLDKPIVFSSELVRTMETAVHNFPGEAVYPIPYIAENGPMYDNKPRESVAAQIADIEAASAVEDHPLGAELATHVVFLDSVNPESGRVVAGWDKSSYQHFLKDFPDTLAKLLHGRVKDGDTVPVIIVGHSGYMRESLNCDFRTPLEIKAENEKHKPKNNEVWLQEYTTELPDGGKLLLAQMQKWTVTMEPGTCTTLFPREDFPDVPKVMCEKDIGRCRRDRFPDELVKRDKEQCSALPLCAGE